jgi:ribosomal protein S21
MRKLVFVDEEGYEIDEQYFKGICSLLRDNLYTFDLPLHEPVKEYLTEKWKEGLLYSVKYNHNYSTLTDYINDNFDNVLNTSDFQKWYNENYYHGYECGSYHQYKKVAMKKAKKSGNAKRRMLKPNPNKGPIRIQTY